MQNMAVDVEVNLQIRREKLKVEKEEKIHILMKKTEEMMQKITMKDEIFVQNHHDTSVSQKEEVENHEQISVNSNYHKYEDKVIEPYGERKSVDLICTFGDITSYVDVPKLDHYNNDYVPQVQINLVEESEANLRNKEV